MAETPAKKAASSSGSSTTGGTSDNPNPEDTKPTEGGSEDKPRYETQDLKLHYPQQLDPNRQIPGTSPYLDEVERERAEIQRAKLEDRKPDLKNPPAVQSTPLENADLPQHRSNFVVRERKPDVTLKTSVRKDAE